MGYPFSDITVYFHGDFLNDQKGTGIYRQQANYITDLYQTYMDGYKPRKTSRIGLNFKSDRTEAFKPFVLGSILSCNTFFDENKFLSLTPEDQNLYILNKVHETMLSLAMHFSWDEAIFTAAYAKCIENDLMLIREYPPKRSRDKKTVASVVIKKEGKTTRTYIKATTGSVAELHRVFETQNYYSFDPMYTLAKLVKWIDKDSFGFSFNRGELNIFFSVKNNKIETTINSKGERTVDEILDEYGEILKARTEKIDYNPFYQNMLYMISQMPAKQQSEARDRLNQLKP